MTETYVTKTTATDYEPFMVGDEAVGEVHWLRQQGAEGTTLLTGMWRCEPSEFPYEFSLDETLTIVEGALDVRMADGALLELRPGDVASFAKGAASTWTVREPVLKFFVVNG